MSTVEIVILVSIIVFFLGLGILYFIHSKKINSPAKKESKAEEKKDGSGDAVVKEPEQKPVPVGIIKAEVKPQITEEYDLAPFKDTVEEQKKTTNTDKKTVTEEIKGLSKDAKKVILSDILKPRF